MKIKRILAGILAAAMSLTSVSISGFSLSIDDYYPTVFRESADAPEKIGEPVNSDVSPMEDYSYIILDDGTVEITGYTGSATEIEIPAEIDGKKVTSIGNYAFSGCTALTSVTIPDSVTEIGGSAFSGCTSLTSVTIPDSVTSIGGFAFSNTPILNNRTEDLKYIGNWLIEADSGINTLDIKAGTRGIAGNAFSNCTLLTSVTIPDSVISIGDSAFSYCASLTSVTIPNSVKNMGDSVFDDCTSLKSITIPDSVISIGVSSFYGCTSLTSVTIPDSVTSIGMSAFGNCTSLTSITIPDSVTNINWRAFYGCTSLTSVTIPDSVTSIGKEVFLDCTSLKSVAIPAGVTQIGDYAFGYAYDSRHYDIELIPDFKIYCYFRTEGQNYAVRNNIPFEYLNSTEFSLEELEYYEYHDGTIIISSYKGIAPVVDLPSEIDGKKVTWISERAFYKCTSLLSITIPDSVTNISGSAFSDCTSLKSVAIPAGVTQIGNYAFGYVYNSDNSKYERIPDFKIYCYYRTEGHNYAVRNNIPFEYLNSTEFSVDELEYNENSDGTIKITGYKGIAPVIDLPSEIDGKKVTSIGDNAFRKCTSLKSVTIPDSVTSIGNEAFYDCTSLKSVTIPNSVTSIGEYSFGYTYNSNKWKYELIPDFKIYCYYRTEGYNYAVRNNIPFEYLNSTEFSVYELEYNENSDGTIRITGYKGIAPVIDLPSEIDGKKVTSIGDYAFSDCTLITSVTIPDSVTYIGERAFSGCTSLTSITIPDGVTSIGDYAFRYCTSLTSVTIPDSVTSIGDNAFRYCTSLTSVNIGSGITDLSHYYYFYHFYDCTSLTEINISEKNEKCKSIDGVVFDKSGENLLLCPQGKKGEYIIPDGVTSIGNSAFRDCTSLTSITIPNSVISIGDYAFENCASLTSITIPNSVTSIGNSAFRKCTSLTSVTIGNSVTEIPYEAFYNCTSLTEINISENNEKYRSIDGVVFNKSGEELVKYPNGRQGEYIIPNGVTSIGDRAFDNCSSLTSITIPDSVTSIGFCAFYGCTSLASVTIPDSVTEIGGFAFSDTPILNNQTEDIKYIDNWLIIADREINTLDIKAGTKGIANRALSCCTSLTSVTIPDSVTYIGNDAFEGCTSLTSITIPNNVTYIGNYAFEDCILLTSINIPDSVTSIGYGTFRGCTSLTSITIPDSVTSIGSDAFYGCTSLKSVTIPDSVTYIGGEAFSGCTSLTSITIPDSVTHIGWRAFYGCTSLTSVTIPAGVTQIGNYAFGYVYNSDNSKYELIPDFKIYCYKGTAGEQYAIDNGIDYEAFLLPDIYYYSYVSIDDETVEITKYAGFATELVIPAEIDGKKVTSIGDYAFENCTSFTSITIPNRVTSIGDYAFKNCTSFTSVTISDSVTNIGWRAFYGCTSLTSINIPDSVTSIGSEAFQNCTSLTSVTIGNSVTEISYETFYNCTSLTEINISENNENYRSIDGVVFDKSVEQLLIYPKGRQGEYIIPDGVTSIGWEAFSGCSSLTSVTISNSVTYIDWKAFFGCTSLTSITIPDSVTYIGGEAFSGCTSLKSVTIPFGVTQIENLAFGYVYNPDNDEYEGYYQLIPDFKIYCYEGTAGEEYAIDNGIDYELLQLPEIYYYSYVSIDDEAVEITDYSGSATELEIPTEIGGKKVTRIGRYAFSGCTSLTSVTIPDSVTSIGDEAFLSCTSLKSVTIPDSVTNIEYGAFAYCTSLTSVTIPDSVTSMGKYVFYYCTSLKSVTIGSGVSELYYNIFEGCTSLTEINISENNENYKSIDGVVFNKSGEELFLCPQGKKGEYIISDGVTSIGDSAFRECTSLTSVTIPDGVTSIGSNAFYNCTSLTSVTIGSGITYLPGFGSCISLAEINISENNEKYKSIDGVVFDKSGEELLLCPKGRQGEYIIPDGVTSIGGSAFRDCTLLTSITIPDSVTSIGGSAFSGCTSLISVTISDSLTSIVYRTFEGCTSLTSITIPNSVTSIGESAFSGCTSLDKVTIGKGVVKVEINAFNNTAVMNNQTGNLKYVDTWLIEADKEITTADIKPGTMGIADAAFRDNTLLTSVTIPNSVTSIGDKAFYGCTSLTSVIIGNSVTSIGEYAFGNCTSLTSITIPNSVTNIGWNAFSGCTSLTKIAVSPNNPRYHSYDGALIDKSTDTFVLCPKAKSGEYSIPYGVKTISGNAFSGCSLLTAIHIPDSVTALSLYAFKGCSSLTSIIIPDSVTSEIGDFSWEPGCDSLETVVIGNGVKKLNYYAFAKCTSLKSVTIGSGVKTIGWNAFSGCTSLTSITIPNGVTAIGRGVFSGCTSLTTVNISDSVISIGYDAFSGCTSLTEINVSENNKYYKAVDGVLYDKTGASLICCPKEINGEYKVPDNVRIINNRAFANQKGLTSVVLGNNVRTIGYQAFENCTSLESINIPASIKSISDSAFSGCTSLSKVTIADGVTCINANTFYDSPLLENQEDGLTYFGNILIKANPDIKSAKIKEGTTEIARGAFSGCYLLESVTIPNSVTSIGYGTFKGCTSLTTITIPDSVTSIDGRAFYNCTSLTEVTIPDSVTSISSYAFYNCTSLTEITIPDSVTSISSYAFYNCTSLTEVTIPDSVTSIGSDAFDNTAIINNQTGNLKYIGKWLIKAYEGITTAAIKAGTVGIGDSAFYNCSSLKSVTIPDSVTSIGDSAFEGCKSLTSITIPDSVTSIGYEAFCGCTSLTSVTIPDGVAIINEYTFRDCTLLTSVTIPDSVTSIGYEAFRDCISLTSVAIPDSVTSIGDWAFYRCTSLKSAYIGNGVTNIGESAFRDCTSLTSVTIPDSVTSIGDYAFRYCSSLKSVYIGNGVTNIGRSAFSGCTSLTSITIPNSVTSIGDSAFSGCTSLTSITIPDSVTSIGLGAFSDTAILNNQTGNVKYVDKWIVDVDYDVTRIELKTDTVGIADNVYNYYNNKEIIIGDNKNFKYDDGVLIGNSGKVVISCSKDKKGEYKVPEGVTRIAPYAFSGCTGITSIYLPDSVTSIGEWAFYGCTSLTSINIPNGITEIGLEFGGNISLSSISIPPSVTKIIFHDGGGIGYFGNGTEAPLGPTFEKLYILKIYCNKDTAAEQYAIENGFDYFYLDACAKHDFGEWETVTPATCTDDGLRKRTCKICGKEETEVIKATGHKFVDKKIAPTYTAKGYTLHTCSVCGYSYKDSETPKLVLAKITGFKASSRTDTTITLSWNKNSEATGYIIEQYKGNKWVRIAKLTSNATTTHKVTGLSAISRNPFRIQAYKEIGSGAVKSAYTNKLVVYTNPKPMSGFKASSKTDSVINLTWAKNTTATGYILEQYKGNKWVRIAKITNNATTTYKVSGLSASTRNAFRIQAYKEFGSGAVKSTYTNKLIVYTNPKAMSGFKASAKTKNTITLSWDKNTTATGYILQQYKGNKWVRIAKITNNATTTYKVSGLTANTRYAFRIQAYKECGSGAVKSAYTNKLVVYTSK